MHASAQAVAAARLSDLDPLKRGRLRQSVQQYGGDRILLELDEEALDGTLGLTARQGDGTRVPTLTRLLLLGKEPALRELVGTHEFAFQVLAREAVGFNKFRRYHNQLSCWQPNVGVSCRLNSLTAVMAISAQLMLRAAGELLRRNKRWKIGLLCHSERAKIDVHSAGIQTFALFASFAVFALVV